MIIRVFRPTIHPGKEREFEAFLRGGITADPRFFPNGEDFRGLRVHQTRLQGGDASSDSYCYTS